MRNAIIILGLALVGMLLSTRLPAIGMPNNGIPSTTMNVPGGGNVPVMLSGKYVFDQNCAVCHGDPKNNLNTVLFGTNPFTLKFFQNEPQAQAGFPADMWNALHPLTDLELDNIAYYMSSRDVNKYTFKGTVKTTYGQPVAGAQIVVTTRYLTGNGKFFAPAYATTAADGTYTVSGLPAGAKTITVSKVGYSFAKDHIDTELNFYTNHFTNGSDGPQGPVFSKQDFTAQALARKPQFP